MVARRSNTTSNRRKWSLEECGQILDFMRRHPFEKPTGADYYRKMLKALGLDTSFNALRSKVQHMMLVYKKAKSLLALRPDIPMSELLLICPHYTQVHEIFHNTSKLRRNTVCSRLARSSVSPDMEISDFDISETSANRSQAGTKLFTSTITQEQPRKVFPQPIVIKAEPSSVTQPMSLQINDDITMPNIISVESISPQEAMPSPPTGESSDGSNIEINDINADSSTAPTSTETELPPRERSTVTEPSTIDALDNLLSKADLKLMELRLREKELELKLFKIQSNERLVRFELESKERIKMKKLSLKYSKN